MKFHYKAQTRTGPFEGSIEAPTLHAARTRLHILYAVSRPGRPQATSIVVWPAEGPEASTADVLFSMLGVELS